MPNILLDKVYNDRNILRLPVADGNGMAKYIDATDKEGEVISQYHEKAILSMSLLPVQSGTGTPSPDNIRPLSGRTTAQLFVSPTQNVADATTYTASWQNQVGTIYGGIIDWTYKILMVNAVKYTCTGTEEWIGVGTGDKKYFSTALRNTMGLFSSKDAYCSHFIRRNISTDTTYVGVDTANNPSENKSNLYFRPSDVSNTTVAAWKQFLAEQYAAGTPVEVVYFTTYTDYDISNSVDDVTLLCGQNYIWSDSSDRIVLSYTDAELY